MAKKRELRIRVQGHRRKQIDTRRMARAILRLAVELDTEHAQMLADALEAQEDDQRTEIKRARSEQRREADESADHKGAA